MPCLLIPPEVKNTAVGSYALYTNTTGEKNTAMGNNALRFNTTGEYNTAIGSNVLYSNTTGKTKIRQPDMLPLTPTQQEIII
jgi:hypothetical protein